MNALQLLATCPMEATLRRPQIMVFGPAGGGKTWGTIGFPGVYMVDCEAGCTRRHYTSKLKESGGVYLGPDKGANDMRQVVGQIQALATQKHDFRTLVIDSFSKLYHTAIQLELDALKAKAAAKGKELGSTYGAEKKPAIGMTRQIIAWLERLDMNVVFVCHEKDLWADGDKIGVTYDAWDRLDYELDLVLHVVKRGKSRKAVIRKSRIEQFAEGKSFDWCYEVFADLYGREVIEAESEPIPLASAKQIAEFLELQAAIPLDQGVLAKWFDKAGIESVDQFDSPTIQKCLDHMNLLLGV